MEEESTNAMINELEGRIQTRCGLAHGGTKGTWGMGCLDVSSLETALIFSGFFSYLRRLMEIDEWHCPSTGPPGEESHHSNFFNSYDLF